MSNVTLSVDARVLGQILLLESGLAAAPDEERLAQMITHGMSEIPGIRDAALCLSGTVLASTFTHGPVTGRDCGAITVAGNGMARIPIATARRAYGDLFLQVSDGEALSPYMPFLTNAVNMVALRLENDATTRRLKETNQRLARLASRGEPRDRSLFENMLNGYAHCRMVYDGDRPIDCVYLEVNRAFETLTGLKNVVGRTITEILPGISETNPEILETYGRVASTGVPERFEVFVVTMQAWLSISVFSPQMGEFVAAFDNVTDRKKAEEEIHTLNAELERRVQDRTAELEAANKELEAFSSSVSHDLRAPLRTLEGFSDALREECGASLSDAARDYLAQITLACRRMGELIDGFLRMARSTRGELLREEVDISAVAVRLLEDLGRGEPGRRVKWSVEPGVSARCDARLAEVVLSNLLANAWKYTAHAREPSIRFSCERHDASDVYVVSDNGAGFDMAQAHRLFRPFQRLHRQEEHPGIGIGLATVQRIVRRHGGFITAEGAPGKGAAFRFTLAPGRAPAPPAFPCG